eukprot:COSAG02_NODE_480_length_21469_cov_13.479551_10_plen_409_part_00
MDVLHEHPTQNTGASMQRWSAKGTLTLASHVGVGVQGSQEETVFVAMVRNDLSVALDIDKNYIAVVNIQTPTPNPTEQPPSGEQWYFVTYSVTSEVSEVNVLRQIHAIEHQSTQPESLLLQGDATETVISAGEIDREIELHPCAPVFLGPDVGFLSIRQWDEAAAECVLDMPELERVCGHFYIECLRSLFPGEQCSEGLVIANSDRNRANPCAGEVGASCEYTCADSFAAAGDHICRPTGVFEGGACDRIPGSSASGTDHWYACMAQDQSSECASYRDEPSCLSAWTQDGQDCQWGDIGHPPDPVGSVIVSLTLAIDIADVPQKSLMMGDVMRENPAHSAWVERFIGELSYVMRCDASRLRFDSVRAASVVATFVIFPGTPDVWALVDTLAQDIADLASPLCAHTFLW